MAGAAGGVGTFVVQLAKARGASVVATASPDHHAYLRDLGADEVLDYHDDWVPAATGVDAAFDAVGGDTLRQAVQAVRAGGRAVTIASGDVERHGDVRVSSFQVSNSRARLAEVAALIDAGQVRVEISARLPLDEAAHAHELVEAGHTRGKILLLPG